MQKIILPENYNYIGVFLSLKCNLKCSYCINHLSGALKNGGLLTADQWSAGLNRIFSKQKVPITLQGGEPSIHSDFYKILENLNQEVKIDLLTNAQFDVNTFIEKVPLQLFLRESPYPTIRISYHPETMSLPKTLEKVILLQQAGFPVGIFSVSAPSFIAQIQQMKKSCLQENIIFKTKDFLGNINGITYGNYKYNDSCFSQVTKSCLCKTSEILISPEGNIHRCHHDLYNNINPIGNILNESYIIEDIYRPCSFYGKCNPCDVKIKNNRFQDYGHCSVTIKNIHSTKTSTP